jgi:hypothetical protein
MGCMRGRPSLPGTPQRLPARQVVIECPWCSCILGLRVLDGWLGFSNSLAM